MESYKDYYKEYFGHITYVTIHFAKGMEMNFRPDILKEDFYSDVAFYVTRTVR